MVANLRRGIVGGRLPHALLFVGPEGVGKARFAKELAKALLCERNPEEALEACGTCPACKQVETDQHPDVLRVSKPDDKHELPIRAIRELTMGLGLKPMRGARRVAIVDDADDLSEEASNAFLKTLEEPPPGSVLVLVGTTQESQLDTVVSRCRVVRFEPLSEAELAAALLDLEATDDPAEADRLARLGEGSVSRALGLADADLNGFRRDLIDTVSSPRGFEPPELASKFEAFAKAAGKESASQRARATLLIGELARFFRAVLWQAAGLESPAPDPDDRRAAAGLAGRLEPEDVFLLADRCIEAEYHVRRMANLGLAIGALMHDLGKLIGTGRTAAG